MTQTLQELDRMMTEQEFANRTGIYETSPVEQVKKIFTGVNLNELFPMFNSINPAKLNCVGFELSRKEYLFIAKLQTVKHLLTERYLIKLIAAAEKYAAHYERRKCLQSRRVFAIEYVSSTFECKIRYHNVSVCYERVCNNEISKALMVIVRFLKTVSLDCVDGLIRRENEWQIKKGLAVFRLSVLTYWANPPVVKPSITGCELVMCNTRLLKHIVLF